MDSERRARLIEVSGRLAASVARTAPAGWTRAVVRAHATGLRGAAYVVHTTPEGRRRQALEGVETEIADLVQLAKGPTPGLDLLLTLEASGGYEAVVTPRSKHGQSAAYCLLEEDLGLPAPGHVQPGPEDDTPAGDPAEAVRLMAEYLAEVARLTGRPPLTRTPTAPELLDDIERRIDRALPADLRALYEAGHHDEGFHWRWLPPEEIPGEHGYISHTAMRGQPPVLDAEPPETVRRLRTHEAWIPFAYDDDGNYLLVDLAPARLGRPGQVVCTGGDIDDGPVHVADSVTELLRVQLSWLRDGAYTLEDGFTDEVFLEFDADRWHTGLITARRKVVDLAASPLPLPDPRVQRLSIRAGSGPLDLAPLAGAPLLRSLTLVCGATDLAPLADLPLEFLSVTGDADLSPLAGHPTLRRLSVATTTPIRLAYLRDNPQLISLDVAQSPVTDLEVLPDFPSLYGLTLTLPQWEELWRLTDRHPRLATAVLHGETDSGVRASWAATLPSAPADPLLTHTGTLPD
ncbi:SMI1/KNR4 family protein [Actinocorallia sp. A-T 12471]|uniref:SMI1/KNR4 family protein n=1 Tax=Actinocorallia sp. A-T 12471 TaxID=3089813 RepID=UPI0029CC6B9E|nr:SMI1/KNR4 family protein [Actinocorallia sp. A-T 12471]MDX6740377.1 SMI1/KNR4 family protein [Actinocorallia sp. A-T 12471]